MVTDLPTKPEAAAPSLLVPGSTYGLAWLLSRPWACIVDRIPKLRSLRRGPEGEHILRAVGVAFPGMSAARRKRLMYATLRQRAYNTAITVLISRIPRLALFFARAIPVRDSHLVRDLTAGSRPIVLVAFHTGPVYLLLSVLVRNLAGRQTHVMHHTEGAMRRDIEHFLSAIGSVSVPKALMATRTLIKTLREKDRPVVVLAGDYAHGSASITFLGLTLRAAEGAEVLQQLTGAGVICAIWERDGFWPHVRFAGPYEASRAGEASLTQRVFAELEPLIVKHPHRWIAWDTFMDRLDVDAGGRVRG